MEVKRSKPVPAKGTPEPGGLGEPAHKAMPLAKPVTSDTGAHVVLPPDIDATILAAETGDEAARTRLNALAGAIVGAGLALPSPLPEAMVKRVYESKKKPKRSIVLPAAQHITDKSGGAPDSLIITPEQLAERDLAELALRRGRCTLQEALLAQLYSGAPAGPYLVECVTRAFGDYESGAFLTDGASAPKTLAEKFGSVKFGNEAQKWRGKLADRDIYECVMTAHAQFPKGHPHHAPLSRADSRTVKVGKTAYGIAASALGLAESTVIARCGRHRKLLSDGAEG